MKDTIKAKNFYTIKKCVKKSDTIDNDAVLTPVYGKVYDGEQLLFIAQYRTMADYIEECKEEGNECAVQYEVFTTVKGNQFIYWGDTETGEDFITKII